MPPFSFQAPTMAHPIIKALVRARFNLTSRKAATRQTEKALKAYLKLAQGVSEDAGSEPVKVPRMLGIDEDMREWSFFMILRHNTIVNNAISATVRRLAPGEPEPEKKFDVKNDVMPGPDCGVEQIALFKSSVLAHLETTRSLGTLRGTSTSKHPLFGRFDAHKWNCMFAFHMEIHLKQAEFVRNRTLEN